MKEPTSCIFRIASEGLPVLLPHMTKQIVTATREDFRLLLAEKIVQFSAFSDPTFADVLRELKHGCCVVTLPTGRVEEHHDHFIFPCSDFAIMVMLDEYLFLGINYYLFFYFYFFHLMLKHLVRRRT